MVGSEISLKCMLSGSLPMTFSWIKDDHELTEDEHVKMSHEIKSAILNLKNAQLSHTGKYVCQAQNKAGAQRCAATIVVTGLLDALGSYLSAAFMLCLKLCLSQKHLIQLVIILLSEPANISEHIKSVSVTRGDPARLECRFSGTKPITSRWMKLGKELISSQRYRIQVTDSSSVLTIIRTDDGDNGEYTCGVSNVAGCSSCQVSVTVLGQFIPKFSILYGIFLCITLEQSAQHCFVLCV